MQAVIMAGGKGTRLSAVTMGQIPKPLVPFCGKPLIDWLIEWLVCNDVCDIVICIGYLGEQIKAHLSKIDLGAAIHYIEENEPLGTAGALAYADRYIHEDFVLLFADLVLDIDLNRMVQYHKEKRALATLFVHPNSHPYDSDLVCCDEENRITGFRWKGTLCGSDYENSVNAGIIVFSPAIFRYIKSSCPSPMALEKDLLNRLIQEHESLFAYHSPEYVKDVGTVDRLAAAENEYRNGRVQERNLKYRQKAVFLDRDGTLNIYRGQITNPDQLHLIDGAAEAVRMINFSGYLAIVITNQPVVARGECTLEELEEIHKRLYTLLGNEGAYVDDLAFCPHHPDKGFPGENIQYKKECPCRKPKPGMILKMAEKYNIDLVQSWMIGDTIRDMQTGRNAGTQTALVYSEATEKEAEESTDYIFESLLCAVKSILQNNTPGRIG